MRGAALIYGCYSPNTDTPTSRAYRRRRVSDLEAEMEWYWQNYAQTDAARRDPLAARRCWPISRACRRSMWPPASATYCATNSERLPHTRRLPASELELHRGRVLIHACMILISWIDAMDPEVDRIGAFLQPVDQALT